MWFMKVLNGDVIDEDGEPALAKAAWCKPNSVDELDPRYTQQSIRIKHIQDAGSVRRFRKILQEMMKKKQQPECKP